MLSEARLKDALVRVIEREFQRSLRALKAETRRDPKRRARILRKLRSGR